ncbi:MAG: hypothetical protein K6F75_02165 [Butyrivibrio sp.]|nr:hypothetical protein [Butyrivibrio sp.]
MIIGLILFFILRYADDRANESNRGSVASFEKMTMTTEQIIANYLQDEQHLCDIWANYVNGSADAGTPMTAEDAMSSNRSYRASLSQEYVRNEIEKGKGKQFDPKFADIMLSMIDEDKEYKMHDRFD